MQTLKGKQDIGCIENSTVLFESPNLVDVEEQFSTRAVVKH
jgi:hypothetical protein